MRHLDLFSGIGGFSLGLERTGGFETVAFCEIDEWCRSQLARNWPGVPVHTDIGELDGQTIGHVDIVTGGFPCQDVSFANTTAKGIDGARSGLVFELLRVIREVRPNWVIIENSPALRVRGADRVLDEMEGQGYTCWPLVVGARHLIAPHRRDRVWIVAHANQSVSERRREVGGGTGASRVLKEVGLHRWGNDAHLLPTPNTPNGGRRVSKDAEWKGTTAYLNGKKQQVGLETAILGHLPTPTATDEWHRRNPSQLRRKSPSTQALLLAGHLPTSTATEYGSSNNGCPRDGRREEFATKGKPSLRYMLTPTATANLNSPSMDKWAGARALRSLMESLGVGGTVALARIYQWMMGYPRGWLDSGSKPTETP